MIYEVRCEGLIRPGQQFQQFDKPREPGDLLVVEPYTFVVMALVTAPNEPPYVELATFGR